MHVVQHECVLVIHVGFTVLDVGEFGQGSRPTVLDTINCEGTEDALLSCSSLNDRVECEFGDTAAVHCAGKITIPGAFLFFILKFFYFKIFLFLNFYF